MGPIKTGLVMLNMGGPGQLDQVNGFLRRLFTDPDIIQLGRFQRYLGPFIADRRTAKIQAQYAQIGGGSPIRRWTELQGRALGQYLDELSPATAPHRAYTAFRYAEPLTSSALQAMADDGVQRAVAFSQYPQYSCTTSGSSINHLWDSARQLGLHDRFRWSLIDRWPTHEGYIASVADCVRRGLARIPAGPARDQAVLVFSSHSLPLRVVERGDQYAQEMGATVQLVVQALGHSHAYVHAWQSKVGLLPWIGPNTGDVLRGLGRHGHRHVVVVPIGFTSDHVETLYELDVQYAEVAKQAGIETFIRAPSLNDSPLFLKALAEIAADHLQSGRVASRQYGLPCAQCSSPRCRQVLNPIDAEYRNLRQQAIQPETSRRPTSDARTSGAV